MSVRRRSPGAALRRWRTALARSSRSAWVVAKSMHGSVTLWPYTRPAGRPAPAGRRPGSSPASAGDGGCPRPPAPRPTAATSGCGGGPCRCCRGGVDDDAARQPGPSDHRQRPGHAGRAVVRPVPPPRRTTWHSGLPGLVTTPTAPSGCAEERVAPRGGPARVGGDLDVSVGRVLEPVRHRQARRQLAVDLALGGARADGSPGHGVGEVRRIAGPSHSQAAGTPSVARRTSSCRASRSPRRTSRLPSRPGSFSRPVQPATVRGFSG